MAAASLRPRRKQCPPAANSRRPATARRRRARLPRPTVPDAVASSRSLLHAVDSHPGEPLPDASALRSRVKTTKWPPRWSRRPRYPGRLVDHRTGSCAAAGSRRNHSGTATPKRPRPPARRTPAAMRPHFPSKPYSMRTAAVAAAPGPRCGPAHQLTAADCSSVVLHLQTSRVDNFT